MHEVGWFLACFHPFARGVYPPQDVRSSMPGTSIPYVMSPRLPRVCAKAHPGPAMSRFVAVAIPAAQRLSRFPTHAAQV